MNSERAIEFLRARIGEAQDLLEDKGNFKRWHTTTKVTLERIYGPDHTLVEDFNSVYYSPRVLTPRTTQADHRRVRDAGIKSVVSLLEAAVYEREQLASTEADVEAFDAELWEHVSHLIDAEQWGQVASTTSTFIESKVREWAGLSPDDFGKNLMVKVFKPDGGKFPCGNTQGEEQGWQQLATGFIQAVSNVDRHRIQDRNDAKTYAMGVLGTASLLITQLRHQHGNRFRAQ